MFPFLAPKAAADTPVRGIGQSWRTRVFAASLCSLAGPSVAAAVAQSSPPARQVVTADARVVTMTYLKSAPGKLSQLERYVRANWFAMDKVAEQRGLFVSHQWLDTGSDAGPWNAIVIVTYRDARGFAGIEEDWREIRAAHREVLIDGAGLAELGRVVESRELFEREPFVNVVAPSTRPGPAESGAVSPAASPGESASRVVEGVQGGATRHTAGRRVRPIPPGHAGTRMR